MEHDGDAELARAIAAAEEAELKEEAETMMMSTKVRSIPHMADTSNDEMLARLLASGNNELVLAEEDWLPVSAPLTAADAEAEAETGEVAYDLYDLDAFNAAYGEFWPAFARPDDEYVPGDATSCVGLDADGFVLELGYSERDVVFETPVTRHEVMEAEMARLIDREVRMREYDAVEAEEKKYMSRSVSVRNPRVSVKAKAKAKPKPKASPPTSEGGGGGGGGGKKPRKFRDLEGSMKDTRAAAAGSVYLTIKPRANARDEKLVIVRTSHSFKKVLSAINQKYRRKGKSKFSRLFVEGGDELTLASDLSLLGDRLTVVASK